MEAHKIYLVGGWYSSELLTRSAADEIVSLQDHRALLKAMEYSVFILAETSNVIHCNFEISLSKFSVIDASEMTTSCKNDQTMYIYPRSVIGHRFPSPQGNSR
jgi:hypothetical protein